MCVGHENHSAHMEVRGQLWESVCSFHYVALDDWTQVLRLGRLIHFFAVPSQCLYFFLMKEGRNAEKWPKQNRI